MNNQRKKNERKKFVLKNQLRLKETKTAKKMNTR